jgi:hypothetical protein
VKRKQADMLLHLPIVILATLSAVAVSDARAERPWILLAA